MQNHESIHEGQFVFDPQDPIYRDHFPGQPVVPGSLIIKTFMTVARSVFNGFDLGAVENFRFKRFISPGCYSFRLQRMADGAVRCMLYDQGRTVVSGTLGHSSRLAVQERFSAHIEP